MTILVTGCAGFIGAQTTKSLLNEGHKVFGVDNLNDYYDVRLKEYRLENLKLLGNFKFYKYDIENITDIEKIFKNNDIDVVINLAARAGVRYSMENPHVYMTTNANGTLNLLELMKDYHVKKMVLASTSSLYAGLPMPFKEDLPVNTPISPYAASKKAAEVMTYTYNYLYDIDVSIVRYFTVYGPSGRPDMSIFRFIKWIDEGTPLTLFGDGTQARDFTYIDDIASGTISAMQNVGYEIINLGGGKNPISINKVISMIEDQLGKKAIIENKPFHSADMKETWADINKADTILKWQPKISFEEGLKNTINWYNENRDWVSKINV